MREIIGLRAYVRAKSECDNQTNDRPAAAWATKLVGPVLTAIYDEDRAEREQESDE